MSLPNTLEEKVNEALYRALNLATGKVTYPPVMHVVKTEEVGAYRVVSVASDDTPVFELTTLDRFSSYLKENLDDLGVGLVSAKVSIVKKGLGLTLVVE